MSIALGCKSLTHLNLNCSPSSSCSRGEISKIPLNENGWPPKKGKKGQLTARCIHMSGTYRRRILYWRFQRRSDKRRSPNSSCIRSASTVIDKFAIFNVYTNKKNTNNDGKFFNNEKGAMQAYGVGNLPCRTHSEWLALCDSCWLIK